MAGSSSHESRPDMMVVVDLTFLCAVPESGVLRLLGFF